MKLLNLNVAIKEANSDGVIDLLKEQQADIVALQEVSRHLEESVLPTYRFKHDLERAMSSQYPHTFFGPLWVSSGFRRLGKPDIEFGGLIEQGNETLSRYPITAATNEFIYRHFEYMQDWSNWRAVDHGRAILVTRLDIDGLPLQVLNLHGIWTLNRQGDERTLKECRSIVEAAQRENIATIITGDFNLLPTTPSIQIVDQAFRNLVKEFGVTSTRPVLEDELEDGGNGAIDYIFVNDKIDVHDFRVLDSTVSDHLPLVLDFSIRS